MEQPAVLKICVCDYVMVTDEPKAKPVYRPRVFSIPEQVDVHNVYLAMSHLFGRAPSFEIINSDSRA